MAQQYTIEEYIRRVSMFEMLGLTLRDFQKATGLSPSQVYHAHKRVTEHKAWDAVDANLYYARHPFHQRMYFRNLYNYKNSEQFIYSRNSKVFDTFLKQFQSTLDIWRRADYGRHRPLPELDIVDWYKRMEIGYEFCTAVIKANHKNIDLTQIIIKPGLESMAFGLYEECIVHDEFLANTEE